MNAKAIAGWVVVALIVWLVIQNPHSAAGFIQNVGDFLKTAASGLAGLVAKI